ncbi:hypothetical protein STIAU_2996 [Stigmatella aurantiaca DW4/3-1]|uniref:Uncharacterized protein n=1 Tax=Stigmatella aurantiaca (strain DW4/3-1) TaxID=378806 RepID=Q09D91_STIAD|nr:hypothetical protein STIAU_2996 [Stigmatella aurantiaca DW4/3-1]
MGLVLRAIAHLEAESIAQVSPTRFLELFQKALGRSRQPDIHVLGGACLRQEELHGGHVFLQGSEVRGATL